MSMVIVRLWPSYCGKQATIAFLWSPSLNTRVLAMSEIPSHSGADTSNCNSCAPDM